MKEYITRDFDRWDSIAYEVYGDPYLYEPIILANPEHMNKLSFQAGIKLKIPVIYVEDTPEVQPPWQRD